MSEFFVEPEQVLHDPISNWNLDGYSFYSPGSLLVVKIPIGGVYGVDRERNRLIRAVAAGGTLKIELIEYPVDITAEMSIRRKSYSLKARDSISITDAWFSSRTRLFYVLDGVRSIIHRYDLFAAERTLAPVKIKTIFDLSKSISTSLAEINSEKPEKPDLYLYAVLANYSGILKIDLESGECQDLWLPTAVSRQLSQPTSIFFDDERLALFVADAKRKMLYEIAVYDLPSISSVSSFGNDRHLTSLLVYRLSNYLPQLPPQNKGAVDRDGWDQPAILFGVDKNYGTVLKVLLHKSVRSLQALTQQEPLQLPLDSQKLLTLKNGDLLIASADVFYQLSYYEPPSRLAGALAS